MESREEIKQYSLEWYKEMRKLNKDTIISLVESNGKQRDTLREQNKSLTDEIAELKDYRKWFFEEQERADKLRMKNLQLQSRIDELQNGNEWISVKLNTMPINTPILCYQKNNYSQFRKIIAGYDGYVFRPFYNGDDDDILFDGNSRYYKITHWMPLPNRPKTN
jgi:hypothetical protein